MRLGGLPNIGVLRCDDLILRGLLNSADRNIPRFRGIPRSVNGFVDRQQEHLLFLAHAASIPSSERKHRPPTGGLRPNGVGETRLSGLMRSVIVSEFT